MEIDCIEFGVVDLSALWIDVGVEFAANGEAGLGGRGCDQLDDGLVADERSATPVLGDVGEETMLDPVPFAGAGRQMADGDVDIEFGGESLKFDLPQTYA